MRSADSEPARGVVEELPAPVDRGAHLSEDRRYDRLEDVLLHVVVVGVGRVVDRHQDLDDAGRRVVLVLHRHLALCVRAGPGESAGSADAGELLEKPVRELDREGHERRGLVAGEAEHEALVPGAALVAGHSLVDVRRLGVDQDLVPVFLPVEAEVGDLVPYLSYNLSCQRFVIHLGGALHLPREEAEVRGDKAFAGHVGHRVVLDVGVENGIGYLVADLVWMAFRNRLAREQLAHGYLPEIRVTKNRRGRRLRRGQRLFSIFSRGCNTPQMSPRDESIAQSTLAVTGPGGVEGASSAEAQRNDMPDAGIATAGQRTGARPVVPVTWREVLFRSIHPWRPGCRRVECRFPGRCRLPPSDRLHPEEEPAAFDRSS